MKKNGIVFCIEGLNNRIKELVSRFNENQMIMLEELCAEASKMTGVNDLMDYLTLKTEVSGVDLSYKNLIFTYIADYIIFQTYLEKGIPPDVIIGYSLGLNTACVCAGNISFEGGIKILQCIKKCLDYACDHLNQDMGLIIGLGEKTIQYLLDRNHWNSKLSIGSINSDYSLLITGEKEYVQKMIDAATSEGALRAVMLHTNIAFHYANKESWLVECIKDINQLEVYKGSYPIMSVYALEFVSEQRVIDELKDNVYCQMKWGEAINKLEEEGYHQFWDVSLDGNLKKITKLNHKDSVFHTFKSLENMMEVDQCILK